MYVSSITDQQDMTRPEGLVQLLGNCTPYMISISIEKSCDLHTKIVLDAVKLGLDVFEGHRVRWQRIIVPPRYDTPKC